MWHVHTKGPNPEGVYHAPATPGRTVCGLVMDDAPFGGRGTKGWGSRRDAARHGASVPEVLRLIARLPLRWTRAPTDAKSRRTSRFYRARGYRTEPKARTG